MTCCCGRAGAGAGRESNICGWWLVKTAVLLVALALARITGQTSVSAHQPNTSPQTPLRKVNALAQVPATACWGRLLLLTACWGGSCY